MRSRWRFCACSSVADFLLPAQLATAGLDLFDVAKQVDQPLALHGGLERDPPFELIDAPAQSLDAFARLVVVEQGSACRRDRQRDGDDRKATAGTIAVPACETAFREPLPTPLIAGVNDVVGRFSAHAASSWPVLRGFSLLTYGFDLRFACAVDLHHPLDRVRRAAGPARCCIPGCRVRRRCPG
jgi:hypothetical protein